MHLQNSSTPKVHAAWPVLKLSAIGKPFPKWQILDCSKMKESADNNFEFDTSGRKFSKWVENTGKRRNCLLRAISPFPAVFSKALYRRQQGPTWLSGKVFDS